MVTFHHPVVGLIQLRTRSTAKRQIIRVNANAVIITVPPGYEDSVFPLSQSTIDSILKMRARVVARTGGSCSFDMDSKIHTLTFVMELTYQDNPKIRSYGAHLSGGVLLVRIPMGLDVCSESVQRAIMRIFHKFMREEAEIVLPSKIAALACKYGFTYNSVKVDSARSRWGCCSSHKDIKLSFYLMLLPVHLVDYIIVHELCHTREMNHGPRFKALLHGFFDNYKTIEKEKVAWDFKVSWLKNNM